MKEQFRRGKLKYLSFIILDLLCLAVSNILAAVIYLDISSMSYGYADYVVVVLYMAFIDVVVSVMFDTLNRVLRRRKRKEVIESLKHVAISFVILALFLFSTKQGAAYSRVTIYLAYGFDYLLILLGRIAWKSVLQKKRGDSAPTAMLITTSGYAADGLRAVEHAGMETKGLFVTDKTNEGKIENIPVMVDRKDAAAFLCWEWIDKVFICGPDNIDVPESLLNACSQMEIPVFTAPASKSLDYEIVKIRTALQKDDNTTGLSFFESEHDIPFGIKRLYAIYESEQDKQTGFYPRKQSWHLLFCPYGSIDVMVDTGRERKTVSLCSQSTGLILHPGIWREIIWKQPGSVLCVAASGHYNADDMDDDYQNYQQFLHEKEWSTVLESTEIMGEVTL